MHACAACAARAARAEKARRGIAPAGLLASWVPEGYGEVFFISHICVIGTNSTCRRLFMPLSIDSLVLLHCLAFSLEFSFSRVVGHRFGGFGAAY